MIQVGDCFLNEKTKQALRIVAKADSFIFQSEVLVAESNFSQQLMPLNSDIDMSESGYSKITYEEFKNLFANVSDIIT